MALFNGYWVIPSCCFAILISEYRYTKSCIITNSIQIDVKKKKFIVIFICPHHHPHPWARFTMET